MTQKLIFILANTDPCKPGEFGPPIFQAIAAAGMSYNVEIVCAGASAALLKNGIASELYLKPSDTHSMYDFIKDAHAAGVKFYCCATGLDLFGMHKDDLIPECSGVVGTAHFIEDVMSAENRVLTY